MLARWSACLHFIVSISFKVTHIYREDNRVADVVSKTETTVQEDIWLFDVPEYCIRAYFDDLWGNMIFSFSLIFYFDFGFVRFVVF